MPFQSEKQKRYLWANEPEIARDWTDTYGSRIHKQSGGDLLNTGILGVDMYPYQNEYVDHETDFVNQEEPLLVDPGITSLVEQQEEEGNDFYEKPDNRLSKFLNMQKLNKYAMPAYNFARGNLGAGVLGAFTGGPLGILAAMFGGQSFKNRRRAKEAARIARIEEADRIHQSRKIHSSYVSPARPHGDGGGNQGSNMGRGQSPTGSDVAGTPFAQGGLANLWHKR